MRVDTMVHWTCKEMQNNKHAKHTIPMSLLSIAAKVRESAELDLDAGQSSVLGQS